MHAAPGVWLEMQGGVSRFSTEPANPRSYTSFPVCATAARPRFVSHRASLERRAGYHGNSEPGHLVGNLHSAALGSTTVPTDIELDVRRAVAFAASIIGEENTAYLDDAQLPLPVHPAIAFSLQWASRFRAPEGDRREPVHGALAVHADSDLRITRPFRSGETVTTQGRLISRRRLGLRVHTLERYRMSDPAGNTVAELDFGTLSEGAVSAHERGDVENRVPRPSKVDQRAAPLWSSELLVPVRAFHCYTECARIYSPIHTEQRVARELGLPGIILHGSATKAIALSQVINRCFGGDPSRITRMYGQLRGMVAADTVIRVECMGIDDQSADRVVSFRVLNETGQHAVSNGFVVGRRPSGTPQHAS